MRVAELQVVALTVYDGFKQTFKYLSFCVFDHSPHMQVLCASLLRHIIKRRKNQRWCVTCYKIAVSRSQTIAKFLYRHFHILVSSRLRGKPPRTRRIKRQQIFYFFFKYIFFSLGINVKGVSTYANCSPLSHRNLFEILSHAYGN